MLKLNRFSDDYMVNPLELLMNAFAYLQRYSPARGRGEGRAIRQDLVEARNGINRGRGEIRCAPRSSIPSTIIFSERVGINERIKMRIPASSIRV